jgi:NADH-quinone oxidoreductase subunit F
MRTQVTEASILLGERAPITSLEQYREVGGVTAFERTLSTRPEAIVEIIRQAGLRGRGGAGFPTATKWDAARTSPSEIKFVVCNGAEGEPGTFKDRYLMRTNPYQVLEGLAIARHVIGARGAYLSVKRQFQPEIEMLSRAIDELRRETEIADEIELVLGPDEYLFGEEKALLEVIEGGLPLPRVFPPYIHGLFGGAYGGPSDQANNPTVVNNVETLTHIPHIINQGARRFRSRGTDESPGTMVFTVCGDVQNPTVRELPLGTTLRELVFDVAGGAAAGRHIMAVFPGLANAVITRQLFDVPLGFDSMKAAGSALGSGGFIVYDDTACMVAVAQIFSRFLYVESCNQCPPCKIGSRQITEHLERLLDGRGAQSDIEGIQAAVGGVEEGQRCYLPTSTSLVVSSILRSFPDDFAAHVHGECGLRHDLVLPKITDYRPGEGFTYDLNYVRKQPDWTYVERTIEES